MGYHFLHASFITICYLSLNSYLAWGSDSQLSLRFYVYDVAQWNEGGEKKFKSAMVSALEKFCYQPSNLVKCGLNSSIFVNFSSSNIYITNGYPQQTGPRYLTVKFNVTYVPLPNTTFIMPISVLTDVVIASKSSIEGAMGTYIEGIGEAFYALPPATLANKIIIPIVVIMTFVLVIIGLGFRHKHYKLSLVDLVSEQTRLKRANKRKQNNQNKVGAAAADFDKDMSKPSWSNKKSSNKMTGSSKSKDQFNDPVEYNNIGYDKSMTEQDVRQRKLEDTPKVEFSSDSNKVLEVRGDEERARKKKEKKHKKKKSRHNDAPDSEEHMLMEKAFTHPTEQQTGGTPTSDTDNNNDTAVTRLKDNSGTSLDAL